jgi:hypothetical protein
MVPDRVGSVGGEILRRFSVIFLTTQMNFLYLRKNRHIQLHLFTIKIEIMHSGVQWIQETVTNFPITVDHLDTSRERSATNLNKFQLKPIFEIANIRKIHRLKIVVYKRRCDYFHK